MAQEGLADRMNAETFAEWLRRQGHKVYKTASSYWYEAGPRVLQAFPYHWVVAPTENELRGLMFRHGILALRYSAPLEYRDGKISYHIVLRPPYQLDALKAQARNGVKNGLTHFRVEQISFERLATEGWELQRDTLERQNRLRSMTSEEWQRLCRAADGLPGFEAWAAVSGAALAGAVIICRIDDVFSVPYAMSCSRFLADHVNNVLFYTVSQEMLGRQGVREVFFTVQSLDAPSTVDDFKLRMGFLPKAVRQRVQFHPWLMPLCSGSTHRKLARLLQRDDANPLVAKTEGMLRFHIEGKAPLGEQCWPDCLIPQKHQLLSFTGGGLRDQP